MKKLLSIALSALVVLSATVASASTLKGAAEHNNIVFGATVGDFSDIVTQSLKPQLEKKGYTVQLIQFSDYVQPNIALNEKLLDANIFQHIPYLDQFIERKPMKLIPLVEVPTAPLGLYAGKKKTLAEVAEGSVIAVPNDPTNLARALRILADIGWVELPANIDQFRATPHDISANPKKLKIVQLEAAQTPRSLRDVDYAIINGNYVVSSGMDLTAALAREKSDAYLNWAVIRAEDKDTKFAKDIKAALQSDEFKVWAKRKFPGYRYPKGW